MLMNTCICYILFSESLNKFYVGATRDNIKERLRKHLTDHKGYTAKAKDWKIVYSEAFATIVDAMKRERQIKGWKSKKMIQELIR